MAAVTVGTAPLSGDVVRVRGQVDAPTERIEAQVLRLRQGVGRGEGAIVSPVAVAQIQRRVPGAALGDEGGNGTDVGIPRDRDAGGCLGFRGIEVLEQQGVVALSASDVGAEGGAPAERPLEAEVELRRVGSVEPRRGGEAQDERLGKYQGRADGVEPECLDDLLRELEGESLWQDQPDLGAGDDRGDAGKGQDDLVVEDSRAASHHGLAPVADLVGEAETRGEVVGVRAGTPVGDERIDPGGFGELVGAQVVADPVVKQQPGSRLPGILGEQADDRVVQGRHRRSVDEGVDDRVRADDPGLIDDAVAVIVDADGAGAGNRIEVTTAPQDVVAHIAQQQVAAIAGLEGQVRLVKEVSVGIEAGPDERLRPVHTQPELERVAAARPGDVVDDLETLFVPELQVEVVAAENPRGPVDARAIRAGALVER